MMCSVPASDAQMRDFRIPPAPGSRSGLEEGASTSGTGQPETSMPPRIWRRHPLINVILAWIYSNFIDKHFLVQRQLIIL
ncbi:hypothetical protein NDU88_003205 [Pleurodeles waltl]|uniref:Uncharacterized protein n=1 Tax=Pleurodeles waltl TaxID=8319 RepID=A0AAV7VCP9_PLEWA|nr:hypothetical protein NDU88_003205 [Pleurodeles waltl]